MATASHSWESTLADEITDTGLTRFLIVMWMLFAVAAWTVFGLLAFGLYELVKVLRA